MSRTSNQVTRPSGLRQSANGQYVYANCVVTGKPTFFKPDYFALVLNRDFGGDENKMAKGYVCKEVKKLRKAGKKDAEIVTILGKFDPKAPKAKKHPKQKEADKVIKPKTVKHSKVAVTPVGEEVVVKAEKTVKPVVRPIYPWSDNPGYFGSTTAEKTPINYEEATKDTCFFPATRLDALCEGCPIFDKCSMKISAEDRVKQFKKGHSTKPVIKQLDVLAGAFDNEPAANS